MPTFFYRGRNAQGEAMTGRMEAAVPEAVAERLGELGIVPIEIKIDSEQAQLTSFLKSRRDPRIKTQDLVFFCRQMYTLTRAGVPILYALDSMVQTTSNVSLVKVLAGLTEKLNAGMDLSSAFASYPKVFSRLFVSMVQVGESTGSLPETFQAMADFLQTEKEIRDRVKSALRYPSIVMGAIIIGLFIINVKVLPAFAGIFQAYDAQLPWQTRLVMSFSSYVADHWLAIAGFLLAIVAGFRWYVRSPYGRFHWDRARLRLPIFGRIISWSTLSRFTRALSITTRSGIPIAQGLPVVTSSVDNLYIEQRIRDMQRRIELGSSITEAARCSELFPPLVLQMLRIGEETGQVDELLGEVADFYEREVDYSIKNLSAAIEPVLIVVIGLILLVVMLAVFLPMWNILNAVKGRPTS